MVGRIQRRGKLSLEEMAYVRQNCTDLTLEEIALRLNRSLKMIEVFVKKNNLKALNLSNVEHLFAALRERYYYQELLRQFTESEILFFERQWADFFLQFGEDVTHTEEMQILELIRTEILINRSMEDRRTIMKQIGNLELLIDEEMKKPIQTQDVTALATWQTQLGALIGSKSSYITEHEKLVTKKEKYLRDLKGTREQRKKLADDAKSNFVLWLRELDKINNREKEGFDLEVQAIAADKARERLADYHEFGDGVVDQPLLNIDTLLNDGVISDGEES